MVRRPTLYYCKINNTVNCEYFVIKIFWTAWLMRKFITQNIRNLQYLTWAPLLCTVHESMGHRHKRWSIVTWKFHWYIVRTAEITLYYDVESSHICNMQWFTSWLQVVRFVEAPIDCVHMCNVPWSIVLHMFTANNHGVECVMMHVLKRAFVINPWRECAERVTVLVWSVYLSVCLSVTTKSAACIVYTLKTRYHL